MKTNLIPILSATIVLAACAPKPLVFEANGSQQGAGSRITLEDGKGRLTTPPLQHWPNGLHSPALLSDDVTQINQRFLTVEAEPAMTLLFVSLPGNTTAFACHTCSEFGLPRDWTLKTQ